MKKKGRFQKSDFTLLPLYLVAIILVLIPLLYILMLSFMEQGEVWGVNNSFSLESWQKVFDPIYLATFGNSLKLAFYATLITFAIGYPFGYYMAMLPKRTGRLALMLVIAPSWTNALVRIYGLMVIMRSNGPINSVLMGLGIIDQPIKMLYTYGSVLVGTVYSLLPFMILPVYSSAEKLDPRLKEAARDLGAGRFRAFLNVSFPLTLPGVLSGVILVFIPSIGMFYLADLVGGGKITLVGNLIKDQLLMARNWPFGAALSVAMMAMTVLLLVAYRKITGSDSLEGVG